VCGSPPRLCLDESPLGHTRAPAVPGRIPICASQASPTGTYYTVGLLIVFLTMLPIFLCTHAAVRAAAGPLRPALAQHPSRARPLLACPDTTQMYTYQTSHFHAHMLLHSLLQALSVLPEGNFRAGVISQQYRHPLPSNASQTTTSCTHAAALFCCRPCPPFLKVPSMQS
jgi:hypothetical protein